MESASFVEAVSYLVADNWADTAVVQIVGVVGVVEGRLENPGWQAFIIEIGFYSIRIYWIRA